jgi:hypothetical protein
MALLLARRWSILARKRSGCPRKGNVSLSRPFGLPVPTWCSDIRSNRRRKARRTDRCRSRSRGSRRSSRTHLPPPPGPRFPPAHGGSHGGGPASSNSSSWLFPLSVDEARAYTNRTTCPGDYVPCQWISAPTGLRIGERSGRSDAAAALAKWVAPVHLGPRSSTTHHFPRPRATGSPEHSQ